MDEFVNLELYFIPWRTGIILHMNVKYQLTSLKSVAISGHNLRWKTWVLGEISGGYSVYLNDGVASCWWNTIDKSSLVARAVSVLQPGW